MLDKEFEFLTVHVDQMMKFLGGFGGAMCTDLCHCFCRDFIELPVSPEVLIHFRFG